MWSRHHLTNLLRGTVWAYIQQARAEQTAADQPARQHGVPAELVPKRKDEQHSCQSRNASFQHPMEQGFVGLPVLHASHVPHQTWYVDDNDRVTAPQHKLVKIGCEALHKHACPICRCSEQISNGRNQGPGMDKCRKHGSFSVPLSSAAACYHVQDVIVMLHNSDAHYRALRSHSKPRATREKQGIECLEKTENAVSSSAGANKFKNRKRTKPAPQEYVRPDVSSADTSLWFLQAQNE